MSLRVCVLLPEAYHWFMGCMLSSCKHLTGIEWMQPNTQQEVSSMLQSADVVVSDPVLISSNLDNLSKVKWVHSIWAGVSQVTSSAPFPFILTRHAGSFGILMAEYVIAQIVCRERKLLIAHQNQLQHKWDKTPWSTRQERLLSSLSIEILGVGAIGSKVAEMCKAFGMTVWGLTRTEPTTACPHVDHHRLLEGLPEVLANSDYVCSILPSTPQTAGLLNGDILQNCSKKKSVLINVGRGDVVSEAVLVTAIRHGWLGGAILDVFEQEPLPESSELWSMPEVVITPHISAQCTQECADVFASQLQEFMQGKKLKHTVEWGRGY
ncbi:glyoxylate/hydroxypyruvate reductase A-like [Halichondria panicea]|uniref:glyoxylate/hydroxypyruvate reductase A-like n=1 Tax=Halichondria panicea TaxID=6063 RepID=UPI00312B6563